MINIKQDDWSDFYDEYKAVNNMKDEPVNEVAVNPDTYDEDDFYNAAPQVIVRVRKQEPVVPWHDQSYVDTSEEAQMRMIMAQQEYEDQMREQMAWEAEEVERRKSVNPLYNKEIDVDRTDYSVDNQETIIEEHDDFINQPVQQGNAKEVIIVDESLKEEQVNEKIDETQTFGLDDNVEVILGSAVQERIDYIENCENENIGTDEDEEPVSSEKEDEKWGDDIRTIISYASEISNIDVDFKDPSKIDLSLIDIQNLTEVPEMNLAIAAIRYYADEINSITIKYKDNVSDEIKVDEVELSDISEDETEEDNKTEKLETVEAGNDEIKEDKADKVEKEDKVEKPKKALAKKKSAASPKAKKK